MLVKIFSIIFNVFSLFNLLMAFEMIISLMIIFIIFIQKNSEEFGGNKNIFGPTARADKIIFLTYILIAAFAINTFFLSVVYKKTYENYIIQESSEHLNEK